LRMSEYPDNDFPWTFYFNGVALPKWGACWAMAGVGSFNDPNWERDVGPRDIYILECRIDHVGVVESADPDIFRYVAQEVLCILLDKRDAVFEKLRLTAKLERSGSFPADPDEIYQGLLEAAFQMRELTIRDRRAFWTNGYESDRLRLIEALRLASLPPDRPDYAPPPHVRSPRGSLESLWREQAKTLHRVASSGGKSKELRRRLLDVSKV
jgi:hypothetical protein